jgi:uncharacterized membrane protein YfhO
LGDVYRLKTLTENNVFTLNGTMISEAEVTVVDTLKLFTPDGPIDLDLSRLSMALGQKVILGSDSLATINIPYLDAQHVEIELVSRFNPRNEVIINENQKSLLGDFTPSVDTNAYVSLLEYKPNYLTYEYTSSTDQLLVFSEIFYDLGWTAYIDGEEVKHVRVNYVLRGMKVPAGEHKIEFVYNLKSFDVGNKIGYSFVNFYFATSIRRWL